MDFDYSFHTHTKRCGHAFGEDREYIESALKYGFKHIGFSDHVFLKDFPQPGFRGDFKELDEYVNHLKKLREEYKNKIDIRIGFEAEYSECLYSYYKELLESKKVDYLICGQHMFFDSPENGYGIYSKGDHYEAAERFADTIIKAMASGLFKYIAHPDFFLIGFDSIDERVEKIIERICKASLQYDTALELNLHGFLNKPEGSTSLWYPTSAFFKYVERFGCKVVIGFDAHTPKQLDISQYEDLNDILSKCNLNFTHLDF